MKLNYHDPGWPEERTVPYQAAVWYACAICRPPTPPPRCTHEVRLDSGVTIFATKDCDECIREAEGQSLATFWSVESHAAFGNPNRSIDASLFWLLTKVQESPR